jgi:hypothetical protein
MQVLIHIFAPGFREKYCLEELWREAEIVDLSIDVSSLTGGSSAEAMRSVSF